MVAHHCSLLQNWNKYFRSNVSYIFILISNPNLHANETFNLKNLFAKFRLKCSEVILSINNMNSYVNYLCFQWIANIKDDTYTFLLIMNMHFYSEPKIWMNCKKKLNPKRCQSKISCLWNKILKWKCIDFL